MLIFIIAIIVTAIVILLVIRLWLNKLENSTKTSTELVEWMKELGRRVETSTYNVDQKLTKNMEMFNNRLDNASFVISQMQKSIGEFSEIGRSMKDLQDMLQSPKLRGNLGEHVLKDLLTQYFPKNSFSLQLAFKNGEKVDAVIKTTQGMIPIDSKFPFDNFKKMMLSTSDEEQKKLKKEFEKDVKKHIQDIALKYILVTEGTVDYALMYIPSESIYYEVINNDELCDFANGKRVLPVSPMSFYAYMKAILMSFEGERIQAQTKEILTILHSIKKDYEKTEDAMSVLQKHVTNSYNQLSQVNKVFNSLGQKLSSTHMLTHAEEQAAAELTEVQEKLLE